MKKCGIWLKSIGVFLTHTLFEGEDDHEVCGCELGTLCVVEIMVGEVWNREAKRLEIKTA